MIHHPAAFDSAAEATKGVEFQGLAIVGGGRLPIVLLFSSGTWPRKGYWQVKGNALDNITAIRIYI